jgi:adenine-specific DNA-methyltransferase
MAKEPTKKTITTLTHTKASRKNIPTAEFQSVMRTDEQRATRVAYERRNRDLDPQLIWRGKYPDSDQGEDDPDLTVPAPPLYIQEKVQPKVLIDDLKRQTERTQPARPNEQTDLFADFNGLPSEAAKTEFYQHDAHWSNRMILGDSLQVMASLAEREGLRGKVQCIYIDPPYGIKFNSNFQWSTTSRDVKDGNADHITREPEQVKAFRDTWRDGIHSYLTYLRDRLTVARDLLTESGSIFVQIGEENVHRVRALMDEVFIDKNFCGQICFRTTGGQSSSLLASSFDILLWYARDKQNVKYRAIYANKPQGADGSGQYTLLEEEKGSRPPFSMSKEQREGLQALPPNMRVLAHDTLYSSDPPADSKEREYLYRGNILTCPSNNHWKPGGKGPGMDRLNKANRFLLLGNTLRYKRYWLDFAVRDLENMWLDTSRSGFSDKKKYVVETAPKVIERCLLLTSDPGDLVLDPTCGSGTTAYAAEQWGRRWITIDTSRVALALARARVMGARYPFYLLADSQEGQVKEAQIAGRIPSETLTHGNVRQGFVYERVPHITLKSIANNTEIDVIWQEYQQKLEPLRERLNLAVKQSWEEWEIPREAGAAWSKAAKDLHAAWWEQRIARQKAIDASIAAKAESEHLYDKPYEDNKKVRVAGPFTVESLSPHRVLGIDENDKFIEKTSDSDGDARDAANFVQVILDNLKTSGVQQADKGGKITFSALTPWPGRYICADGRYIDSEGNEKRAAIQIGPEFGTVSRPDLVSAAREAGDAAFDILIACAFSYDAHSADFDRLGRIPVLKARMNADLHMATDLKNTGKGNLFVIFGEPDITVLDAADGEIQVRVNGVDVFHPSTGEIRSSEANDIACWFVDTDYNEESFFVRQAYFLGANDPYKALKTTLKAEINEEAWATLHSDTSRPFPKPESGRIAVKVINHLGDEVMKVFKVAG